MASVHMDVWWLLSLSVLCSFACLANAEIFHAYPDESCAETVPLAKQGGHCSVGGESFTQCIASLQRPGDECRLHAGRYPFRGDPLKITGLYGTASKPFVIAAAAGEEESVILDGTLPVKAPDDTWYVYALHSMISCAKAQTPFWQMFVEDEMQVNARWPDALWSDLSVFNVSYWGQSDKSSQPDKGIMVDDGSHGGAIFDSANVTGAVAVLNTGSWNTYPAIVTSGSANTNSFTYNATGQYHDDPLHNRYFLEDQFDFIDQPSEWFYDMSTNTTCLYPTDGYTPDIHRIVGKVSTYALNITNCSYVTFANMTFFATTLYASSMAHHPPTFIDHLSFISLNFSYPSYSRRMLHDVSSPMWTVISSRFPTPPSGVALSPEIQELYLSGEDENYGYHTIFNCTFMYTDGPALDVHGRSCTIENNYFAYNDWSGADETQAAGALATINSNHGYGDIFKRNTLYRNGASTGYRPPANSTISHNHITGQCFGDIQHDGAGMQIMAPSQQNTTVENNWIHDSVKYGIRFDGQPPRTGQNGTMRYNIAWECGGLIVKGDYHYVEHNLAFDLRKETPELEEGQNCSLCVYGYVRTNPVPINNFTVTTVNAADYINGGTGTGGHSSTKKVQPLPGNAYNNIQANIRLEVMDADNLDFRPRKNSTFFKYGGVGPYPATTNPITSYWIPGRQWPKAATPVPPNGSVTVKAVNRDAVMWLPALNAISQQVVFLAINDSHSNSSTTPWPCTDQVLFASAPLQANVNVFYLPKPVVSGQKYCWRVDTSTVTESSTLSHGDVWVFATI